MNNNAAFHWVESFELPNDANSHTIYKLLPVMADDAYYAERTDRNIGWITPEEQQILRSQTIGIAGCGGMGGALAERFLRLGIGEIRIADSETFDVSNINRQLAATRSTVGRSKAIETARVLRRISDDSTVLVYPQGISADTVQDFVAGCDVICDEIELWELAIPIMLHQAARAAGVSIFGCNTVGFGTHLFLFTPRSATLEEVFGLSLAQAQSMDDARHLGQMTQDQLSELIDMLILAVVPEVQEYCPDDPRADISAVRRRLLQEGKASIISTNPAFATGFIADRVLLYLLRNSGVRRDIVEVPEMPGYLYLDAAKMQAKVVTTR